MVKPEGSRVENRGLMIVLRGVLCPDVLWPLWFPHSQTNRNVLGWQTPYMPGWVRLPAVWFMCQICGYGCFIYLLTIKFVSKHQIQLNKKLSFYNYNPQYPISPDHPSKARLFCFYIARRYNWATDYMGMWLLPYWAKFLWKLKMFYYLTKNLHLIW